MNRCWHLRLTIATQVAVLAVVGPIATTELAHAAPPPSDVVLTGPCEQDVPGDWLVIDEASGVGDGNIVCNYAIGDEGGAAITINWYCDVATAAQTWSGLKSGDRPTRTINTDTEQRMLEGPLAPKDNAHRDGVFSTFFPDVVFTWFEKSWLKINEQVIATVVVISGRAPTVPGEGENWTDVPRIDMEAVDAIAVDLAAAQVPELAPCSLPPIASRGTGGTTSTSTGGHTHPGIVIAAGGTAVIIGGVIIATRRRRPKRQVPGSPDATGVPPRCIDLDRRYTEARERMLTLMDAEAEVHRALDKALAIQRRNVATANLALGFDAGRLIGGALAAVPLKQPGIALRGTSPGSARPQWDTWRPPSGLPTALSAPLEALARAASTASNKVSSLRRQLTNAASHPQIRMLRDRLDASTSVLTAAKADLVGSRFARQDLARITEQIAHHHDDIARGAQRINELEHNVGQLMPWAAHPRMGPAIRQNLRRTLDLIKEARARVDATRDALPALTARRRSLANDLQHFGDLHGSDLQRMLDAHQALARELAAAESSVTASLERQLAAATAEEHVAAQTLTAATEQARRVASEHDTFGRAALRGTTTVAGWVLSPLTVPMGWLAEQTFGTRQTPQEMLDFLNQGAHRVTDLMTAQHVIERAIHQRRGPLELLHHQLAACVAQPTSPEGTPHVTNR